MAKLIIDISDLSYKTSMDRQKLTIMNDNDIYNMIANGTLLPDNATNGDIIKTLFPKDYINIYDRSVSSWWNTPYKLK